MSCGDGADWSPANGPDRRTRGRVEAEHVDAVMALVKEMQWLGETDVEAALHQVNATNVAVVPGARFAGITVVDDSGAVQTLAATDDYARVLDDVQRETGQGPCLSAAWSQHTIHIDNLNEEQRWPRFCEAALARSPVRSMVSFRLLDDANVIAALNFHADSPGVFDDESIDMGLLAAAHTTMAWNMLNREQQFRGALASRDIIGQAKGMLMERFDIDAVAAFELLKRLSQRSNTKLADVADRLTRREHPGR